MVLDAAAARQHIFDLLIAQFLDGGIVARPLDTANSSCDCCSSRRDSLPDWLRCASHRRNQVIQRECIMAGNPKWREETADAKLWERTQSVPAGELWRTHERRRERLVALVRRRLQAHCKIAARRKH